MRDLFMLGILPLLMYAVVKRPFIGLGMWVWTALFFPNAWVYGLASSIRYNLLFTALGVISYLAMKHKPQLRLGAVGFCILVFFLWTTLTTVMTSGNPDISWEHWNRFAKVILLFLFVMLIVEKKLHVDFVLWCFVLSVGFYANLESIKFIFTGGGHMISGFPGHVLGDRNELALAFVMTIPICFYLMSEYGRTSRFLKYALCGTIGLLVIAVIGTQSRGGFIALMVLGGYLFMKSDRKILLGLGIVIIAVVVSVLASEEWSDRINTIESANEDASFMGRVVAWKLSFLLAIQHPIFGGGFKSLEYFPVWQELSRSFFSYPWFYTGDALPNPERARAAHSIYFQVLGDHGFIGLALYLCCLIGAFGTARKLAYRSKVLGVEWLSKLGTALQLSIFSFALGGAALSFAYFDMIFALFGLTLVLYLRVLPSLQAKIET